MTTQEQFEENVAAIQGAIDDMNNGDSGRDADEVIAGARERLNLSKPQTSAGTAQ